MGEQANRSVGTGCGVVVMRTHDGASVRARLGRWAEPYREVYAEDMGLPDHADPPIADRLARHADRPGFGLVAAEVPAEVAAEVSAEVGSGAGDQVAGYVYGYPLPVDTLWWKGLRPAPDPGLVTEWPGRTVGICEVLIRPGWRHRGIAERLCAAFLASRREERAVALVAHTNTLVLALAASYGWQHVGDLAPYPRWRPHAALMLPLRGVAHGAKTQKTRP